MVVFGYEHRKLTRCSELWYYTREIAMKFIFVIRTMPCLVMKVKHVFIVRKIVHLQEFAK